MMRKVHPGVSGAGVSGSMDCEGEGGANVCGSIDGEVMSQEWHC